MTPTGPHDDDLPSELEVWADATEREAVAEWDRRLDADAELPPDLLDWGRSIEYLLLRHTRDQLRAEVARLAPDPIERELRLMLTPTHTDEAAALSVLIDAAATPGGNQPPREATVTLAIATASPWAGERTNVRDRPRRTAWSESEFARWVDRQVPPAQDCAPLPTDRGAHGLGRPPPAAGAAGQSPEGTPLGAGPGAGGRPPGPAAEDPDARLRRAAAGAGRAGRRDRPRSPSGPLDPARYHGAGRVVRRAAGGAAGRRAGPGVPGTAVAPAGSAVVAGRVPRLARAGPADDW